MTSDWQKWLGFTAGAGSGTAINYYPASSVPVFLADSREASAGMTLRPSSRMRLDEKYLFTRLRTAGECVFTNHIARSRVNYQFSREASLRFIVDYNGVLPNARLAHLDRSKHIGLDALFTYMLNPGTALYLGYTDLYDNLRLDPTLNPALTRTGYPDLNTGRQVFVKLSYLLRF
jgi:hypothetical protein